MKQKKNGFTLIELLSVIIILGIILSIAIPRILDVINNSKEKALESSAKLIVKIIEQEYEIKNMNSESFDSTNCEDFNWDINNGECNFSINDGIVTVSIIGEGKFKGVSATGTNQEIEVIKSFEECGDDLLDIRDGNTYKTVEIGNQCWFGENLKYTTSACLSAEVYEIDSPEWNDGPQNKCFVHGSNEGIALGEYQDGITTEVKYQWDALMNGDSTEGSRGLCPNGWYVPTDNDFTTLERTVCSSLGNTDCITVFIEDDINESWRGTNESLSLKDDINWSGNNNSGFKALPSGFYASDAYDFVFIGSMAQWWSSSTVNYNIYTAWTRHINDSTSTVGHWKSHKSIGHSVRCIKQ